MTDAVARETMSLAYTALALAAGGRDLLEDSNAILRRALETGTIKRPGTRQEVLALVMATSRGARA
jgi:hypothetical protein